MQFPFFGFAPASNPTGTPGVESITISANEADFNLLDRLGYTPTTPITVTLSISAAVEVSASSTAVPAMDLRGLPVGSTINFTNLGYVLGRGGDGGNSAPGGNGWAGGAAIYGPSTGNTLNITNASGNVWGGGGGGGGGADTLYYSKGEWFDQGGGGGGGGAGGSLGGSGGFGTVPSWDGADGNPGTGAAAGAAGTGGAGGGSAGDGGTGGAYGAAGSAGQNSTYYTGGSGGAAGYYVRSDGGTVNWISGGSGPNVKGSAD